MEAYLPYFIDYLHFDIETAIIFAVSVLLAIMVHAEGQAFVATFLGDIRQGATDRFHYNVFLHMSVIGTLSFFLVGFGWPKEIDINPAKFKYPRLFYILSKIAGPMANLLLASIAASLNWLMGRYGVEDKVFLLVALVNINTAVYSMLLIPPLAGASLYLTFLQKYEFVSTNMKKINLVGAVLLILLFGALRITGREDIYSIGASVVLAIAKAMLG